MERMKKSDLKLKDYSWKALGDDPKKKNKTERTQLNRKQGYEVLYFINYFLEKYFLHEPETGRKIEAMLRERVPTTMKDRSAIEKWLVDNWG
jgi:hypothetical protein